MDRTISTLAKGSASALVVRGVGMLLWLLVQFEVVRAFGADSYGIYAVAFAGLMLGASVLRLGFDETTLRYLSIYRSQGAWELARGVLSYTLRVSLALTVPIALLLSGMIWLLSEQPISELAQSLVIASLALPLIVITFIYEARFRALERVGLSRVSQDLIQPTVTLGVIAIGAVTTGGYGAPVAMAGTLAGAALGVAVSAVLFRWIAPHETRWGPREARHREWFAAALQMSLASGLLLIGDQSTIVLVGLIAGTSDAGLFTVALRIAKIVGFALVAVNAIAAPLIAERYARRDRAGLQHLLSASAAAVTAGAVAVGLGIVSISPLALEIFGSGSQSASDVLRVLVLAQVINAVFGSVAVIVNMTGHQWNAVPFIGLAIGVQTAATVLLTGALGVIGAAWATVIGTAIWNAGLYLVVKRQIGVDPTISSIVRRIFTGYGR